MSYQTFVPDTERVLANYVTLSGKLKQALEYRLMKYKVEKGEEVLKAGTVITVAEGQDKSPLEQIMDEVKSKFVGSMLSTDNPLYEFILANALGLVYSKVKSEIEGSKSADFDSRTIASISGEVTENIGRQTYQYVTTKLKELDDSNDLFSQAVKYLTTRFDLTTMFPTIYRDAKKFRDLEENSRFLNALFQNIVQLPAIENIAEAAQERQKKAQDAAPQLYRATSMADADRVAAQLSAAGSPVPGATGASPLIVPGR